ncbi:GNAT family N-acetyltransferase [Desulfosporosinus nitroreducens]|uniref:GNAT family N-acetyltransferase n=1 Tax=Desulfosporosinus nitroreducens TaxID=2018668 RepID=A0ABT8QN42_9FIRM|nr:GNAT family N-acetyltransferase [Desulfosporosinus nitroreducens]MDO0822287.1 GNAT family N-acetyltransferase [Desulfosporosinus nitroreducens]
MTIRAYVSLSQKAIAEVLDLEGICIDHDSLRGSVFLDSSLNINQQIKSFFLLYKNGKLISMLSMFIPTKNEAEITAYTQPKFRGKGYFKSLLGKAVEELRAFDIPELLFVCESPSIPGKRVIDALNADYDHTEYFMRFDRASYTRLNRYRLILSKAEQKDLEKAIAANMKVFGDSREESKNLIKNCFSSDTREQYFAVLDDEIIGVVSVNLEEEDVSIFGFGIVPEYRSKGYGKELLHLIVDDLLHRGRSGITIDVNNENADALELYQKTGFHIEAAYEYYRKKSG